MVCSEQKLFLCFNIPAPSFHTPSLFRNQLEWNKTSVNSVFYIRSSTYSDTRVQIKPETWEFIWNIVRASFYFPVWFGACRIAGKLFVHGYRMSLLMVSIVFNGKFPLFFFFRLRHFFNPMSEWSSKYFEDFNWNKSKFNAKTNQRKKNISVGNLMNLFKICETSMYYNTVS